MSEMGHEGFSRGCVGCSASKRTGGGGYESLASGREAELSVEELGCYEYL